MARSIAGHLQLPSSDEDIFRALDTVPPLDPPSVATAAWGGPFDASELVLINGALAGYAEYFSGGSLGDLVWAPNLLLSAIHISGWTARLILPAAAAA